MMSSLRDEHHYLMSWFTIVIIALNGQTMCTNAAPQNPVILPQCPPGYQLIGNLCYYQPSSPNYMCPPNYFMASNSYCYPNTLTSSTTSTTTTTAAPNYDKQENIANSDRCPADSIFLEDKCRKIICSLGEYYDGHCLQPACPPGLVWRAKSCQTPGYIITIVEVDNVLVNTMNEQNFTVSQPNATNAIYRHSVTMTTTTATPPTLPVPISRKPYTNKLPKDKEYSWLNRPSRNRTLSTSNDSRLLNEDGCCTIVTPRICKDYTDQWICFNRRHKRCDRRICSTAIIYLRAPEVRYKAPMLIMPPFPQGFYNTSQNTTVVNRLESGSITSGYTDCSGCIEQRTGGQCDAHCYSYLCPEGICSFLNLKDYCNYYSGQYGCLPEDGCLWSWC